MSAISRLQRHVSKGKSLFWFRHSPRIEDRLISVLAEANSIGVKADDLIKFARIRADEILAKQQQPTGVNHE